MYFPIEVVAGDDYEVVFQATNPANSQPIDLRSGYSVKGEVAKAYFGTQTPLYEWKASNNNYEMRNGSLLIEIPGAHSREWTFRRVFYDIKVINSVTNQEVVIAYGPLINTPTLS